MLYRDCNHGKGNYYNPIISAPWQKDVSQKRLRVAVLERDKQCTECGTIAIETELTIIRKIPLSAGGRMIYDNLKTVCKRCKRKIYLLRKHE